MCWSSTKWISSSPHRVLLVLAMTWLKKCSIVVKQPITQCLKECNHVSCANWQTGHEMLTRNTWFHCRCFWEFVSYELLFSLALCLYCWLYRICIILLLWYLFIRVWSESVLCHYMFIDMNIIVFPHRIMVVNATFNNISVISWRSVLLVEETGVYVYVYVLAGENQFSHIWLMLFRPCRQSLTVVHVYKYCLFQALTIKFICTVKPALHGNSM